MKLHLVDLDNVVVEAWTSAFKHFPEVSGTLGGILTRAKGAVASPANSYGFMDGGIGALGSDRSNVKNCRHIGAKRTSVDPAISILGPSFCE